MTTPVHHHKLLVIDPSERSSVKDLYTGAPDEPIVPSVTLEELAALAPPGEQVVGGKAPNLVELRRSDRFVAELGDGRFVDIRSGRLMERPEGLGAQAKPSRVVDPSRIAAALEE
ncbi:MAG: hypothetical protein RIT81_07010 [Deltaproteobacteria bacterium]